MNELQRRELVKLVERIEAARDELRRIETALLNYATQGRKD